MTLWDPSTTPSFSLEGDPMLRCQCGKCGGLCEIKQSFMIKLQGYRNAMGSTTVLSGFRCPLHPEELKKALPGSHSQGRACDVEVIGSKNMFHATAVAHKVGMVGLGQANNALHMDEGHDNAARPAMWKYC